LLSFTFLFPQRKVTKENSSLFVRQLLHLWKCDRLGDLLRSFFTVLRLPLLCSFLTKATWTSVRGSV
jgi:hypothetical protein